MSAEIEHKNYKVYIEPRVACMQDNLALGGYNSTILKVQFYCLQGSPSLLWKANPTLGGYNIQSYQDSTDVQYSNEDLAHHTIMSRPLEATPIISTGIDESKKASSGSPSMVTRHLGATLSNILHKISKSLLVEIT